jgi:hypothetical protein
MITMPTAFFLTGLTNRHFAELADFWKWTIWRRVKDEFICITPNGRVVRILRSASRACNLPPDTEIWLGPLFQECDELDRLIGLLKEGKYRVSRYAERKCPPQ